MRTVDVDAFFRQIIEKYGDMLFRISLQYVRNRCDAEDVVQDVFMSLLKYVKKEEFNGEEHVKAWLIRVTIRKSINAAKHNRRRGVVPLNENIGVPMTIKEGATDLRSILGELGALDREIIYLHYYEGYSTKEIASFVGKSEKSVYKRLSRARQRLRVFLTDRG